MKTPHPHKALLIAIANGEKMQYDGKDCIMPYALNAIAGVNSAHRVRVKPPTIMIGSVEVPEPMREAPEQAMADLWYIDLNGGRVVGVVWYGSAWEQRALNQGLLQATEQGAKDMLAALLKQLKA
jgi:hypothetical protein